MGEECLVSPRAQILFPPARLKNLIVHGAFGRVLKDLASVLV